MEIPQISNAKEVLNVSVSRFDVRQEAERSTIDRLLGNETNNFRFYDIPVLTDLNDSDSKRLQRVFKSIHRLGGSKVLSNEQKTSMQNANVEVSPFELTVLKTVKRKKPALQLGEIYQKMNPEKQETQGESEDLLDNATFNYEIDQWEKRFLSVSHSKPDSEARRLHPALTQRISTHGKSRSYNQEGLRKRLKLPTLAQRGQESQEKEDFEVKYLPKQEELFRQFRTEIYTDETFRRLIVNYTKLRGTGNGQETDRADSEDCKESIEDLKKEIQGFFVQRSEEVSQTTIIERARQYEQGRARIEKRLNARIRNSEAFINNKQITGILLRKENSYIIEKMSKIKHLMKELQFLVLNNAAGAKKSGKGGRNSSVYAGESGNYLLRNASLSIAPLNAADSRKSNLLSIPSIGESRKSNIGKLIEKNLDLKNKETELLGLKSSYRKFEEKLEYNRGMLQDIEKDIKREKEGLKEVLYARRNFFINLLKQGFDSGNEEGVSWIVRSLWAVGFDVKPGHLPEFLDPKAKEFVLQKARLEKEIREMETMSRINIEKFMNGSKSVTRNEIKVDEVIEQRRGEDEPAWRSDLPAVEYQFKPLLTPNKLSQNDRIYAEMQYKLREELIPKSNVLNVHSGSRFPKSSSFLNGASIDTLDVSMSLFENEGSLYNFHTRSEFLKGFEGLQKGVTEKRSEVSKEERKEVVRMIKEFDYKQYAKRFQIDCETVLAALVGAKKANKELIRNGMIKNPIS